MSGRSIQDGLALVRDCDHFSHERGVGLSYISQSKKAFNMMDHHFLIKAMRKMGIKDGLVELIEILHLSILTKIQINGIFS